MNQKRMDSILNQIARSHQTTPNIVRKEMEFALEKAQNSKDPAVQAKWAAIPRKGNQVTLEEFLEYRFRYRDTEVKIQKRDCFKTVSFLAIS